MQFVLEHNLDELPSSFELAAFCDAVYIFWLRGVDLFTVWTDHWPGAVAPSGVIEFGINTIVLTQVSIVIVMKSKACFACESEA